MHSFGADNYLTRVFDTLPQGMLIVDPQWIVLKLNPAAERMFGVVQDQVKGRVLWKWRSGSRRISSREPGADRNSNLPWSTKATVPALN